MKKFLTLIAACAGLFAFAGTLDGSSDEALTKSFVAEWQGLNDADTAKLGMAVYSAFEQLRDMTPEQRNAKLNGKTLEEFITITKELSPNDFASNEIVLKKFSAKDTVTAATVIRRFLKAVKPKDGFKAMLATVEEPLSSDGMAIISRIMAEAIESLPPDQVMIFLQALDDVSKIPGDRDVTLNLLLTDGPNAVIEKFKETNPKSYETLTKQLKTLKPSVAEKMKARIVESFRTDADNAMAEWEKLDVPQPSTLTWIADFEAARKQAAAEDKPMFVLFTGSDWCPWCIKLEKQLLSTPEFAKYAKDNLVLVLVDFPRGTPLSPEQTAANRKLSDKYDVSGFPTVLLMDAEGKVIGKTGYKRVSPEEYVNSLKKILSK